MTHREQREWLGRHEAQPHQPPDAAQPDNSSAMLSDCTIHGASNNPKDIAARAKCPLQLIPPTAETEIAWVLHSGAMKYGPWNWRRDRIELSNYLGAMRRHIARILDGEDVDAESGRLHLAHVAATAIIMIDALAHDCVIDDRP